MPDRLITAQSYIALEDVPVCIALPDGFGVWDMFDGQTWSIPDHEPTEEQP